MTKCTCFKNGYLFLLTSGFKLCCKLFSLGQKRGRWLGVVLEESGLSAVFCLFFFATNRFERQFGLFASSACCDTKKALAVLLREEALLRF